MKGEPADSAPSPRVGRRTDLAAIGFALLFPTLITLMYFVVLAGRHPGLQQVAYSIGKVLQFAFPLAWVWWMLRERPELHGPTRRGVWLGLGFGGGVAAVMLAAYYLWLKPFGFFFAPGEAVREKLIDLGLDSVGKYVALSVFYSLFHSLLEEYYWRWFVFRRLAMHVALVPAIGISSVGFASHHVVVLATYFGWLAPATWLFALAVATGGAAWAWLYYQSRSLYGPWLSHMLIDAAIFLIGFDLARDLLK